MVDHYKTLQVTRDAEPEVIERAYKALSRSHHPDRRPSAERENATRRMQRINEAYGILRDPAKRARYDAALPAEDAHAWDVFWDQGLVGMFTQRFAPKRRA